MSLSYCMITALMLLRLTYSVTLSTTSIGTTEDASDPISTDLINSLIPCRLSSTFPRNATMRRHNAPETDGEFEENIAYEILALHSVIPELRLGSLVKAQGRPDDIFIDPDIDWKSKLLTFAFGSLTLTAEADPAGTWQHPQLFGQEVNLTKTATFSWSEVNLNVATVVQLIRYQRVPNVFNKMTVFKSSGAVMIAELTNQVLWVFRQEQHGAFKVLVVRDSDGSVWAFPPDIQNCLTESE